MQTPPNCSETQTTTTSFALCRSFHGRLCPRRCNCRFWSLWNPFLHMSHTKWFFAINDFGDRAITSTSGSACFNSSS
ncbi:hypothetical protein Ahy_A09g044291 [Arachis hypogaea]|uniref:Uncharacterized protein n=1 Tax=Arachis hypogaea TaxID=3818 RepID=A0A445BK13_ARAHY|nr:hypothetical protein Ahy_A09g044291 [Arachis hypogaea]